MSRSPRKRPTTRSSSSRRRFLRLLGAVPASLAAWATLPGRPAAGSRATTRVAGHERRGLRSPDPAPPAAGSQGTARAVVLGTAQDAGVPQANCFTGVCRQVREGLRPAPRVASLGLVDVDAGRRFLVDATPDVVAQLGDLLAEPDGTPPDGVVALADRLHGILLTHGHMGHYTGLAHLGREAAASDRIPVWCNPSTARLLREHEPWQSLVAGRYVQVRELEAGTPVRLSPALEAVPLDVVHRAELTATTGYLFRGSRRSLLYVPDADRWDGWTVPFEEWLDRCDEALLDGSFWSGEELGHRPQAEVPHPPVSATLERLRPRGGRPRVRFIHLNHTNPLWDEASDERRRLEEAGFAVAETGQRIPL